MSCQLHYAYMYLFICLLKEMWCLIWLLLTCSGYPGFHWCFIKLHAVLHVKKCTFHEVTQYIHLGIPQLAFPIFNLLFNFFMNVTDVTHSWCLCPQNICLFWSRTAFLLCSATVYVASSACTYRWTCQVSNTARMVDKRSSSSSAS